MFFVKVPASLSLEPEVGGVVLLEVVAAGLVVVSERVSR
jgi:hypothetical protein